MDTIVLLGCYMWDSLKGPFLHSLESGGKFCRFCFGTGTEVVG